MTEHDEHDEHDAREERAFRTAFVRRADELEPVELGAVTTGRRRRPWLVAAVAAAVLVVVGGTGVVAIMTGDDGSGRPPASGGRTDAATPPSVSPGTQTGGRLPAPDAGWRWTSWRDVAVQVPASWSYGLEPPLPWCMYSSTVDVERAPYVAQDSTGMVIPSVGCAGESPDHHPEAFGPAPVRFWAPHVSFADSTGGTSEDAVARFEDWTLTSRTVDGVTVSLLVDSSTADLGDRILGSARTFETDQSGCDASSPVQAERFVRPEPFDLARVDAVDSISVCQYSRAVPPGRPALMGSRLLTGPRAASVLDAIRSAPVGGGPDTPRTCLHDQYGDTAIALRLHTGDSTREVYVYYDTCFGNGFDDGTTRRELTVESCLPLFGDNVALFSGGSAPFHRCHE
ncbi:MAG: hypothetical protein JWO76_1285 [Nocardioides sp.]|nr:hypothetical protein [Nocardioides sp.]